MSRQDKEKYVKIICFVQPQVVLENKELSISPMVILELEYLYEAGRINKHAQIIIDYLSLKVGLKTSNDDFNKVIHTAINEKMDT